LFSYDVINNVLPIIAGAKLQRFLHPTKFSADYFLIAELFISLQMARDATMVLRVTPQWYCRDTAMVLPVTPQWYCR
jgi:hypothetical protein